jgi:hypothetical protein
MFGAEWMAGCAEKEEYTAMGEVESLVRGSPV